MTGVLDRPATLPATPVLRPYRPGDPVRAFLAGLSLESAYRRFFTGIGSPPSATLVRRLTTVTPARAVVLAVATEGVIGLADSVIADDVVELGVVVADGWQRHGLGWPLCIEALRPALDAGVPTLRAHTLPDNARVARMLRRRWPDASPRFEDGTLIWDLPLRWRNVLTDMTGPVARER